MVKYDVPTLTKPPKAKKKQVLLVASGDLRLSANQVCWKAQEEMEEALAKAVADAGYDAACTVKPGANLPAQDPLALRRTEISGDDGLADFRLKLSGGFDTWHRLVQLLPRGRGA